MVVELISPKLHLPWDMSRIGIEDSLKLLLNAKFQMIFVFFLRAFFLIFKLAPMTFAFCNLKKSWK